MGSWATYFNDRLKLRDGLGALDPNTVLFRHLTRLFTYPVTLAHVSFAVAVEWDLEVEMTTVGLK